MSDAPGQGQLTRQADAPEGVTRGFLFADLRGYTEYVERHGGAAAAELLGRYRELVREEVARFRGAEIKTEGDSFYVVFPSASAAVRAGLAIVDAAAQDTLTRTDQPIRVGVGVHAGETVETSEGYVGSPVNIAARLCVQAAAGELLVSDTVRALTSTVVRAQFVPRGRRQLKGIREPMHVFAVSGTAATTTAKTRSRRPCAAVGARATAGIVAVVLVAAAGFLVLRGSGVGGGATPPTPTSQAASASTSPTPVESGLSRQERDLLDMVPADVVDYCSTAPDDAVVGATATVRCDLPLGSGADTVWWHFFETEGVTVLAFDRIAQQRELPDVPCSSDVHEGRGEWSLQRTFSGERACYRDDAGAWAVWTYTDEQVLARAIRTDGNSEELDAWWREIAQYLRAF